MKIKIEMEITPDELRKMLPPSLQALFDSLVQTGLENGMPELDAKTLVANLLWSGIQSQLKAKKARDEQNPQPALR